MDDILNREIRELKEINQQNVKRITSLENRLVELENILKTNKSESQVEEMDIVEAIREEQKEKISRNIKFLEKVKQLHTGGLLPFSARWRSCMYFLFPISHPRLTAVFFSVQVPIIFFPYQIIRLTFLGKKY